MNLFRLKLWRRYAVAAIPLLMLFLAPKIQAQTPIVKGFVRDEKGSALPGASVTVKGTSNAVATGTDGDFTIIAARGNVLLVKFIGYNSEEVVVGNQQTINISLKAASNSLNEVVVVGYGTQSKKDLTGSVAIVNVADAKKTATYDVARALQGQAAGVTVHGSGEPGGSVQIKIRGVSSLDNNNPLFVIDGVLVDGPFDFPTDEIESIQVLKDATAAAIYGFRGSTGVVIITTKKGKNGPLRINYSGYYGPQTVPKTIPLTNREQYQQITRAAELNAGLPLTSGNNPASPNYISNVNTDWQKAAFKTGITQNHDLNFSGGNENATYNLGLGYFNQTGTIQGPDYNRYNITASTQGKQSIFSYGAKVAYTQSRRQNLTYPHAHPNIGNEIVDLVRAIPTVPVMDPKREGGYGGTDKLTQSAIVLNIIGMNQLLNSYSNRNRFLGNVWGELEPIKNLKYRVNVSYDRTDTRDFFFEPTYDLGWYYQNASAYLTDGSGSGYSSIIENTLSYSLNIHKNKLELLAGTSYQNNVNHNIAGSADGLTKPYILSFTNDGSTAKSLYSSDDQYRIYSPVFGRVNYSFDDRYLITYNFRRDGASFFTPQNRYGNFSSVSAGWNIGNEKFMHLPKQISSLKIRGGYGTLGNLGAVLTAGGSLGYHPTQAIVNPNASYNFGPNPQYLVPGTTATTVINKDIKWETKVTTSVGVDASLFDDRLTFTAEYYENKANDILLGLNIPLSVGSINNPTVNAASFKNTGLEFTVGYHETKGPFTYAVNANVSTLKNKVLSLGAAGNPIYGAASKTDVGGEVGQLYGFVTDGLFQNAADIKNHALQPGAAPGDMRFKDLNNDGVINDSDRQYLGSAFPKVYYGFNLGGSYKSIDASIFIQGNYGGKAFNGLYQALMVGQYTNNHTDELNYWTPSNTNTNIPRPVIGDPNGNSRVSDRFVESDAYARLQSAQIGYNFQQGLIKKLHMQKLRVYVSGQNLYTVTKYKSYDPDFISNGTTDRGFDYGSFPNPRSVLFGLQVGF